VKWKLGGKADQSEPGFWEKYTLEMKSEVISLKTNRDKWKIVHERW
jgi:hypothetical protein